MWEKGESGRKKRKSKGERVIIWEKGTEEKRVREGERESEGEAGNLGEREEGEESKGRKDRVREK